MTVPLRDLVNTALHALNENFIFRKIGMIYDYRAATQPSALLPHARDIRASLPNATGNGSGLFACGLNSALLFDGYALRWEIGYATAEEMPTYDRLIGGLIRLATIAPRNTIIRGLAPDGKSYYPPTGYEPLLYWAFNAYRAATTPTMSPESQHKVKNICLHWMENLEQHKWQINAANADKNVNELFTALIKPALLAVAFALTKMEKWKLAALKQFSPAIKIAPTTSAVTVEFLFNAQMALYLLAQIFEKDAEFLLNVKAKMREIALAALPNLTAFRQFDAKILADETPFDWRTLGADETPDKWTRHQHENQTVALPLLTALTLLWSGDGEILRAAAADLKAMFSTIAWDKLRLARSLTPLASIHALGILHNLWDADLTEYQVKNFDGAASLVAPLMTPTYDAENSHKHGHTVSTYNRARQIAAATAVTPKVEKSPPHSSRSKNRRRGGRKPTPLK